ncbi:MAG: hypothetical protein N5P05_004110 (plasmid) [Chroococcopsis gigantea SAG 12.99]|jgi:hypothetical protein|nr:hypothetical protein [Chroococcopsis gigantea SAG 12.99]
MNQICNLWSKIIEAKFTKFMALFFPGAYKEIDWEQGFLFLDDQLRFINTPKIQEGCIYKLVQVEHCQKGQVLILIHVQTSNQPDASFVQRLYTYNYRLYDIYQREVATLVVSADTSRAWRPSKFSYEQLGCNLEFSIPVNKLLDHRNRSEELLANKNPFAIIVLAYIKAWETQNDFRERLFWKLMLVKNLYKITEDGDSIVDVFYFINNLLALPEKLERRFLEQLEDYERLEDKPYIASLLNIGVKAGKAWLLINLFEKKLSVLDESVKQEILKG